MRCKTCSKEAVEFITTDGILMFVCFWPGKTVIEKKEQVKIEINLEEYKKREIIKLRRDDEKLRGEIKDKLRSLKKLVENGNFGKVPEIQEDIGFIWDRLKMVCERLDDFGA